MKMHGWLTTIEKDGPGLSQLHCCLRMRLCV